MVRAGWVCAVWCGAWHGECICEGGGRQGGVGKGRGGAVGEGVVAGWSVVGEVDCVGSVGRVVG